MTYLDSVCSFPVFSPTSACPLLPASKHQPFLRLLHISYILSTGSVGEMTAVDPPPHLCQDMVVHMWKRSTHVHTHPRRTHSNRHGLTDVQFLIRDCSWPTSHVCGTASDSRSRSGLIQFSPQPCILMMKQKLREKSPAHELFTQTFSNIRPKVLQPGRKPSPMPAPAPLPTHTFPGGDFFGEREESPGPPKVVFFESPFPSSTGFALYFLGTLVPTGQKTLSAICGRAGKGDSELREGQETHLKQVQESRKTQHFSLSQKLAWQILESATELPGPGTKFPPAQSTHLPIPS